MDALPPTARHALDARRASGLLRTLPPPPEKSGVDFFSNDYLGFSRDGLLAQALTTSLPGGRLGSTGSRLLSGNSALAETLETEIAAYHEAEAALLFNSGYDANVGLLASLARRSCTVLYDKLCHASIRDGITLGHARAASFRHQDLDDLREKLDRAEGDRFVVAESLYSMDGDLAPLERLVRCCEERGAYLILDEAHAGGVIGSRGEGLAGSLGLAKRVFARVHTFGKALGAHGAAVLGSNDLRDYLINFARPLIYSTALDRSTLTAIQTAYRLLPEAREAREKLQALIARAQTQLPNRFGSRALVGEGPIQAVVFGNVDDARAAAERGHQAGYAVRAILSPTVPEGTERIRICLHAFNSDKEFDGVLEALS